MNDSAAIAAIRTPWNCKWSRLKYRLNDPLAEQAAGSLWVCVRPHAGRTITEQECDMCEHWERTDEHET